MMQWASGAATSSVGDTHAAVLASKRRLATSKNPYRLTSQGADGQREQEHGHQGAWRHPVLEKSKISTMPTSEVSWEAPVLTVTREKCFNVSKNKNSST
jgi:hypothetical protein